MISVDDILHDFIDDKIAQVKSDPSILDTIFEGKPVEKIESFKQYIANTHIRSVYHHPRDATEWPCYAIVLESNNESDQVIGSSGDAYDEVLLSSMEDGWIGSDSDINLSRSYPVWVDATSTVPAHIDYGAPPNIFSPVDVKQFYSSLETKDGRRSCHVWGAKGTSKGKGIWIDFQNSVLEGGYVSLTGKNYVTFWIKSNRAGTFLEFGFGEKAHREHTYSFPVTTIGLWERIRIDIRGLADRDKDTIRYMSFRITMNPVGDLVETDVYIDVLKGEKSSGEVYEETYLDNAYRIESWSENAELTLGMHQILLWNMLKYRTYFETSWGLLRQRIEGGDIMPQPELYPAFVYVRGLVYSCTTIELVPRESGLSALSVEVGRTDFGQ